MFQQVYNLPGKYLNSRKAYTMYESQMMKPYFVDKSALLAELFPLVQEGQNYICITRPRRFGKTSMGHDRGAEMVPGQAERQGYAAVS